jgi:UDP-2,3-diacylglucosamine pyrophosphatase LpxH
MPRVCARCQQPKPLEAFAKHKYSPLGIRYACRECDARDRREKTKQRNLMGAPGMRTDGERGNSPGPKPRPDGARSNQAWPPNLDQRQTIIKERPQEMLRPHSPGPIRTTRGLTIAVGDTHFPFHSKAWLSWALDFIAEAQPDNVIQMGDLFDMYAFSKYPRSLNVLTPNEEIDQGRRYAAWFWSEVQRLAPGARCYQLHDDNHGHRANNRAREHYASAERFVEDAVRELHTFEGVTTMANIRGDIVIDDVIYQHGNLKFGAHARKNRQNTVIGHLHRGMLQHDQDGRAWEMCVGWGGSVQHEVFSYAGKTRAHGTTLGLGVVDSYGARFVPFEGAA